MPQLLLVSSLLLGQTEKECFFRFCFMENQEWFGYSEGNFSYGRFVKVLRQPVRNFAAIAASPARVLRTKRRKRTEGDGRWVPVGFRPVQAGFGLQGAPGNSKTEDLPLIIDGGKLILTLTATRHTNPLTDDRQGQFYLKLAVFSRRKERRNTPHAIVSLNYRCKTFNLREK